MKELLRRYAAYTIWANQKLFDCIRDLPEEQLDREIISSFSSIRKTMLHMWDAESGWWQRMKMQERIVFPNEFFKGTMQELASGLLQQSKQWEEWVAGASDLSLEHVFQYQNTKREVFKMPVYQMVHHVFNHGTYHRGQLVNMLRQLGTDKIPSTDFSTWTRLKK